MNHLESTLVCITTGELLVSTLSLEQSIVPRRMLLSGDPQKLVHAKGLGRLVVAINQTKLVQDDAPRRPARRVIRPGIQFLNPDTRISRLAHRQVVLLGQAGSRITSMLSWTPKNRTRSLETIVIGLYIDGPDTANCDGRLIYLNVKENGQNPDMDVEFSRTIRFVGSPIYALAQYDSSLLVVCAGTHLFLSSLDISTRHWPRSARCTLPSPAVSLHVSGQFIFATTARHSLRVFEVDGGELILRPEGLKTRDVVRGATQFLGTAEGGLLSVATNKGGRVLGLSKGREMTLRLCLMQNSH